MPDILTIPKTSSFPPYLDFVQLREAGIRHIEKLGSAIWTDYNTHDPGITILEALCFVLTDLGYRTNFDINELLARSKEAKEKEPKTIFNLPYDDNFFTAAEVLSCNPVTINDLRKLLIDIPGVKNAWFQKAPESECPIFLNRKLKILQLKAPFPQDDQRDRLFLRGLYDVCVELDELLITDACGRTFFSKDDILEKVYATLQAHRNLCEDIREVLVLGDEQIAVCADIELQPNADPQNVLLELYKQVEEFLSPTLRFYTLQEMLERKVPVEEIFAGRPLSANSHGFIDLSDLKKQELKSDLHVSDIYQVIMDIPGVAAVRNLALANYIDGIAFTKGEKWCLPLKPYYRPHFDLDQSKITFFKGVLPFTVGKKEIQKRYNEEKAAKKKAYLEPYQLNLPIPEGEYRNLEEYTSILEEFPLTYGVGAAGIKQPPTPVRLGQSKQLKAYLLFFDQLLANYLAQLTHLRDLFSVRSDELPERQGKNHTYFTHVLHETPGIEELVKNFKDCTANDTDAPPPEDYPSYLQYIAESLETYQDRRSRFLDHLLARFAESFTDYVLLSYKLDGEKLDPARIIQDKADFLKNYPDISRNRGKGMNYTATPVWDTKNTSGLERRVSKLIGIDTATRHTLAHTRLVETEAGWAAEISDAANQVVLTSKAVWPGEQEACDAVGQWKDFIGSEQYYRRLTFDVAGVFVYGIEIKEIVDGEFKTLAIGPERFPSIGRYCEAVKAYSDLDYSELKFIDQTRVYENGDRYFVITNSSGTEILRSFKTYPSGAPDVELNADFEQLKDVLLRKQIKHYCRADFKVDHNNEYGFILLDAAGNVIAESKKRYLLASERDAVIHGLINLIQLPKLHCDWAQETNCFYFELYDYLGQKQLFVSKNGFDSRQKALAFFDKADTPEDFKGWAVQFDHYEETGIAEGPFSFNLKDSGAKVQAVHPHEYGTEQERNDRLQAIIYYLDEVPPTMEIEEEKAGDFQFDITDASGKVLLKSSNHYATQLEAENAAWKTRLQARHRVYYKPNSTAPYSFSVVDRHGNELAYHPDSYATECERDLAIDTLLYGAQNIAVQHGIDEQADGFHYTLLNPEGDVLMNSVNGYPDAAQAEAAWLEFLGWAMHKDQFHITEKTGAEYPFGFELWDNNGQAVASSIKTYATEAEAKMAVRAILNYICHTEWTTLITGEPGIYWFKLIGLNGRVLLRSAVSYPDEPSTLFAYQAALLLAGDKNRYFDLPNFEFDLRDGDGNIIALHPQQYVNDMERDAAKNLIISYVRNDAPWIETPNTGGAFYGVILGPDNTPVFIGTTIHPNREAAETETEKLLLLATDRDNYRPHADSYTACRFGFYLIDETGMIVARHPKTYPSAAERDQAMLDAFAWLSYGEALTDDVIQGKPDYRFALKNNAGKRVFTSVNQFDTPQEAETAFAPFLTAALEYVQYEKFTDGPSGKFGFRLLDIKGSAIAQHPKLYLTEDERETAIREIILLVSLRGAPYRIFEDASDWKYALQNAANEDVLIDSVGTPAQMDTEANLQQAFIWAQQEQQYLLLDDDASCAYGFALSNTDLDEIASHPDIYGSQDLRNAAIDAFIGYLSQLSIEPEIFEVQGTFYFQLIDFAGNILLKSKKDDYSTVAATKIAWSKLVQAVNDPANFQVIYDNANCLYSVGILVDGTVIACPPYDFPNRTSAKAWIDTLVFLLKKHQVNTVIAGTSCGYYFVLEHTENGKTTKLAGAKRYPNSAEAQRACHEIAALLQSTDTFKIEQVDGKWQLVVCDASGELVAKSEEPLFDTEAEAQAVYDEIVQKLAADGKLNCQSVFREHAYRCSLLDQTKIVFQYTPGAQRACHKITVLLRSTDTFKVEQTAGKWYLVVYDPSGQVVSRSIEPPFESEVDAQIVYNGIVQKLSQDVEVPCQAVFQEHEYGFSLLLETKTVLQHTPGKPFIRFGRSEHSWASRAVRDAIVGYFQDPKNRKINTELLPATDDTVYWVMTVEVFDSANHDNAEKIVEFKFVSEQTFDSGDDDQKKKERQSYLEAWNTAIEDPESYQMIDDETNCRYSFEIIQAAIKNAACQDCSQLLELAQQQARYSFISNEDECLFGFELTDPEGVPIAVGTEFFKTELERNAAIDHIIQLVNAEGMHLVEHLLLRPRKKALEPRFVLEFKDETGTQLLLRHVDSFVSEEAAIQAFWRVMITLQRVKKGTVELIRKIQENPVTPEPPDTNDSCWLIEVLDQVSVLNGPQAKVLAISPEGFCVDADCDQALALINKLATDYMGTPIDPANPPALPSFADIKALPRLYDDLEEDILLPIIGDCAGPARQLPVELSDPYSFRATVVLPYWPARFQRSEFRSFLETTLRQEAPAHVFLRICWVDACQMQEFEAAYERWLKTKVAGAESCDASAALNALINILFRLRNIYPAGRLHDCAEPDPNANQIVLNYSIIGSANQ